MNDSSLISLLKSFSHQELNLFEKFLQSPYFTEGRNIRSNLVLKYFYLLKKYYPSFSSKQFTKEYVYSKLYPKTKYKDEAVRKINSDLLNLAERFLIQIELEDNQFDLRKNLIMQFLKRKQEKLFRMNFNSALKYLKGLKKDKNYFYESHWIWQRYWDFHYGKKNMYKMEEAVKNNNNFFVYVLLKSLRIYLWNISIFRIINKRIDLLMFDEILSYVGKNIGKFNKIPQILFLYYLIMLFLKKDEIYFEKIKELKASKIETLSNTDKLNLYIMMTNYLLEMINSGKFRFRRERFELDKEHLTLLKKLFFKPHYFLVLSAVRNAVCLGEFEWVEKMIPYFEKNIAQENKDYTINYIKADMNFFKKNYDEAIKYLATIKTTYSHEKQQVRNLMLQIYFETSSYEPALSIIDASKHFLKRDKRLSESLKLYSLNFIRFTEKLINMKEDFKKKDMYDLKMKTLGTNAVFNKDWLLEKMKV